MQTHPTNIRIKYIERAGAFDRYGQPSMETVYTQIRGFFEKATAFSRSLDGDSLDIDAALVLAARYALKVKDRITLENPDKDKYMVVDVDESLDHMGQVIFRTYALAKQRQDP